MLILAVQVDKIKSVEAYFAIKFMQGSHSHGKSGKVMEKFVVMESHGK